MGVQNLETFLEEGVPNAYCSSVNIRTLAEEYKKKTGKDPVVLVDGFNCLRSVSSLKDNAWLLGGQIKGFVEAMKDFVSVFEDIGIIVKFFFDGACKNDRRDLWVSRRGRNMQEIKTLLQKLNNKYYTPHYILPPIFGATARFVAKFECHCDVILTLDDCDREMAEFAKRENCLAILSQDTDFVFMEGAQHYLSLRHLDTKTMNTLEYRGEDLQRFLDLRRHEMLLLPGLLGNDVIPKYNLQNFHNRVSPSTHISALVPSVAKYIREQKIPEIYDNCLRRIAKDVFGKEGMASSLETSIRSYLPTSKSDSDIGDPVATQESQEWRSILEIAKRKHVSGDLTTHVYPVMCGEAYELSTALEPYGTGNILTATLYRPMRQRIYGVLLHENPRVTEVEEWCVEGKGPSKMLVHVTSIPKNYHPGMRCLLEGRSSPAERWRLFAETLTQGRKLDSRKLESLNFPYVVPVAVLFYLLYDEFLLIVNRGRHDFKLEVLPDSSNQVADTGGTEGVECYVASQSECLRQLDDNEVDAILVHAASVSSKTVPELTNLNCGFPNRRVIHLSTIFHRGVATVLFLLSACGFEQDRAMPWFYFDGKLLQMVYNDIMNGARPRDVCGHEDAYRNYKQMRELLLQEDVPTRNPKMFDYRMKSKSSGFAAH